jgi:signal transduction histidine kinase
MIDTDVQSPRTQQPQALEPRVDTLRQGLFTSLNIAAYVTWAAVVSVVVSRAKLLAGSTTEWIGAGALLAMLALFVSCALRAPQADPRWGRLLVVSQAALVVLAEAMLHGGQTAVLMIIVASQAVLTLPMRAAVFLLIAANSAIAWLWIDRSGRLGETLQWMVPVVGFQAFAALTGLYAAGRERAREHLAQVNAELMATRMLLEESARAGERLKLSRELHDVAGHTLTALKLNLARLARDPTLADREEIRISTALADDLLAQIRQVVGALRAHDGVDLRTAFEALTRATPGVRIGIDIEEGLRVDNIDRAETLLRCAQEAITNALRHGRASRIDLRLGRDDDGLTLSVDNDGLAPTSLAAGNGLTGMRERVTALGGDLTLMPTPPRGLRVRVRLPEIAV